MISDFSARIRPLLGQPVNDPDVIALLRALGADEPPEMDQDGHSGYVSREDLGISLIMKEPAFVPATRFLRRVGGPA